MDTYLTSEQVATLLGIAPKTIKIWRNRGEGPRFIRLTGQVVRYRLSDAEWWIERQALLT